MRLKNAHFNKREELETVDVNMTTQELALIYQIFGQISPNEIVEATGGPYWTDVLQDLCQSGTILGIFYEEGAREVLQPFEFRGGRQ